MDRLQNFEQIHTILNYSGHFLLIDSCHWFCDNTFDHGAFVEVIARAKSGCLYTGMSVVVLRVPTTFENALIKTIFSPHQFAYPNDE
jgi:hypothetical protein